MLILECPYCGVMADETDLHGGGEAHLKRYGPGSSDEDFEAYLFQRDNPKGVNLERWRHAHGCGRFFNAIRHTVSDKFLKVYKSGEPRPSDEEIAELMK